MKKTVWMFALMLLAALTLRMSAGAESEEPNKITEGEWTYIALSDTTAELVEHRQSGTSITVPAEIGGLRVTSLSGGLFYDHRTVTEIILPDTLTSITGYVFRYCNNLKTITLPDGVSTIERDVFDQCNAVVYANPASDAAKALGAVNLQFTDPGSKLVLQYYGETLTVVKSDSYKKLESCVIPEGVHQLGSSAFADCSNLTSVTLPSTLTRIDEYAFHNCNNLSSLIIPDGLQKAGSDAFSQGYDKPEITLYARLGSDGARAVGGYGFIDPVYPGLTLQYIYQDGQAAGLKVVSASKDLTECVIPEGVTAIDRQAFASCSALASISVPSSVTSIGDWAFDGCSSLAGFTIPSGVTEIGNSVFHGCSSLPSITIPAGVTSIGSNAFFGCTALAAIDIPGTVQSIGSQAFSGCASLKKLTLPEGLISIEGSAFYGCTGLLGTVLPESVTSIAKQAFPDGLIYASVDSQAAKLLQKAQITFRDPSAPHVILGDNYGTLAVVDVDKDVSALAIPGGVTRIKSGAFKNAAVVSVTIPDGMKQLESGVFQGCYHLKSIRFPVSVSSIGDSLLDYNTKPTIYCSEFSTAAQWAKRQNLETVFTDGGQALRVELPESVTVAVGFGKQISFDIFPAEAGQQVSWQTSDAAVVAVGSEGLASGVKTGSATVTLTVNGVSATTQVRVAPLAEKITLPELAYVPANSSSNMPIALTPANAETDLSFKTEDRAFAWATANPYDKNYVSLYGVALGDVKLTITDKFSGVTAETTVRVCYPVTEISAAPAAAQMNVGDTLQLTANVKMRDQSCVNQLVRYQSYNEEVATINEYSGLVTAVGPGQTTIRVFAQNQVEFKVEITVGGAAPAAKPGDVTGDDKTDIMDVIRLLKYVSGWSVDVNLDTADVNGDGNVNIMDVIRLLKHVSGWDVELA